MKLNDMLCPVLLAALMTVTSCASKTHEGDPDGHHHGEHDDAAVWREMDDFHMIMAETFHPYKDSVNLEPVRRRATELMEEAHAWAAADLPEKVNNAHVKAKLRQLKEEAAALAESVKAADDNVIGEQLTRVHDTFHEIQEAWYGGH